MKLSVVIPYFNADATIGRMLDSLLDQDLAPEEYEILVVDDGSEEEAVVVREYEARYPQIHYFRREHGGLSPARNFGISVAQGDWLYICDSDDYVQPRVFGGLITVAEKHRLEHLIANYLWVYPSGKLREPRRNFTRISPVMTGLDYMGEATLPLCWAVWDGLIRRNVIVSNELAFEPLFYVEDRLFKLRLLPLLQRVAAVDVDLLYYVQNPKSVMHSRVRGQIAKYLDYSFLFMDGMLALIRHPDTPVKTAQRLLTKAADYAMVMVGRSSRHGSLEHVKACMDGLAERGLYPIGGTMHGRDRILRGLMNRRGLWLLLYRLRRAVFKIK